MRHVSRVEGSAAPAIIGLFSAGILVSSLVSPVAANATPTQSGSWDIDGDGKLDKVTLEQVDSGFPAKARLSVDLSRTGRTATLVVGAPKVASVSLDLVRAVPIDGRPGDEILLSGYRGANTTFYVVISLRGTKLQLTRPPGPKQDREDLFLWFDTSALYGFQYYSRTSRNGKVMLYNLLGSTRVNASQRTPETLTIRPYEWRGGKWQGLKKRVFRFDYPSTIQKDFDTKPYGRPLGQRSN